MFELINRLITALQHINVNWLILIFADLILIYIIYLIISKYRTSYIEHVKSTSARYKKLLQINSQYAFAKVPNHLLYQATLNSKAKYDHFNYYSFFESKVEEYSSIVSSYEHNITNNYRLMLSYRDNLNRLPPLKSEAEVKALNLSWKTYNKFETRLITEQILTPQTQFRIICKKFYQSPKGQNIYSECRSFNLNDYHSALNNINKRRKEKESKEYQRKIMTDTLRYNILKRDGFRCQICGRSQKDGVKLVVDHILPIAKGGKTVPENLRTLCNTCNSGKSDKYDYNGYN